MIVVDVLLFDAAAATVDPSIVDIRDRQGTPISGYDAQIAAICRTHDALLATRNEKDFAGWALNSSIRGEPNSSAPPAAEPVIGGTSSRSFKRPQNFVLPIRTA